MAEAEDNRHQSDQQADVVDGFHGGFLRRISQALQVIFLCSHKKNRLSGEMVRIGLKIQIAEGDRFLFRSLRGGVWQPAEMTCLKSWVKIYRSVGGSVRDAVQALDGNALPELGRDAVQAGPD